jgi:hypothetical protein
VAAVTHLGATASTSNTTSYVSGSFTPAIGDLLVVYVAVSDTVAATTTLTESAGGGTYVQIGRAAKRTSLDSIYVFVRNTRCETAAARTFTWATTDAATGCVIAIAKVTGMSRAGLSAVRQFDTTDNGAAATTPNTVFPAAALTANPYLAGCSNGANPAGVTPPVSSVERVDTGYSTPATGLEYASRDSGFVGTTVSWGAASASAWGAFSMELDTSVLPSVPPVLVMAPRRSM